MKLWNINDNDFDVEIELGLVTVLKGSHGQWFKIVRLIEDFFNNRSSEVTILEDTQLLHKKDFECLIIPFDAHLQIDKITAKSPLKSLLDEVAYDISLSPSFAEFTCLWQELQEEVNLLSRKFAKYDINISINNFEIDDIKPFISFQAKEKMMTPLEYKKLLLTLFTNKYPDKKRIVVIELPELYADEKSLQEFGHSINLLCKQGTSVIIVSSSDQFKGNMNFITNDQIVNNAKIELIKRKVINELPFYCDDQLFNEARNRVLKYVDNCSLFNDKETLSTGEFEKLTTIIFLIAQYLNIRIHLDISILSPNLKAFTNSYTEVSSTMI